MAASTHTHGSDARPAASARNRRRLAITLSLMAVYMVAEVVGGVLTNSLALLADASHMLTDIGALALSLFAVRMARKPATAKQTYGYYRIEILAALVNGAALVAIAAYILVEAVSRLADPPQVLGAPMLAVATGGLLVNLVGLAILNEGKQDSLNLKGAWLHVMTDALGSIGAMASGLLIWTLGWHWADPVASTVIAGLVVYSSWNLLKEATAVLMEGAPGHIDVDEVRNAIAGIEGVLEVHDLHIWTITSGMESLSGHVVVSDASGEQELLAAIREALHARFGIDHITVQIEKAGFSEGEVCE